MKKVFLTVIAAVMICSLLAGCSFSITNKPDQTIAAQTTTAEAEKETEKETEQAAEKVTEKAETETTKKAETETTEKSSDKETEPTTPGHVHTWTFIGETTPTCISNGLKEYVCSCGEHNYETTPKNGHTMKAGKVVAPKCEEEGYTVYECKDCPYTENRDKTPAIGHDVGHVYHVDSSCTYQGMDKYQCKHTGCTYVIEVPLPLADHSWYLGMNIDPSCMNPGGYLYRCNNCPQEGIVYDAANRGDALGHAMDDIIPDYDEGLEAFYHIPVCIRCGTRDYSRKGAHVGNPCAGCGYSN